ncbi:hypothetical protein RvY_08874-2 [Ramazzottius varieornatus]|uniref:sn-1-specific diacylglycerol lipase n=1 Tax=Ramazzottius varieornatus TaxID=947166 RepID=A0A1D1VFC5_RAMVA|nr:hypothetical protein RvY_08874-2 [Ramazzottius varieornatus]
MDTKIRKAVRPYLYARCALFLLECGWMISTAVWLGFCPFFPAFVESVLLGTMIFNAVLVLLIGIGLYLSYDLGGGKWLKLRKYQTNLQATGSKLHHGHHHRTWRTRKTAAAYHISWQKRCRFLFCCLGTDQRASLASIAQLLSDFFRDLDLVPTDIIAGLILLRRYQKLRRYALLTLDKENTFQFLSATPITPETKFLKLSDTTVRTEYERLVRYMRFSLAVYGWPMYVCRGNPCRKLIDVIPGLRCVCCFGAEQPLSGLDIEEDNCCGCHSSAMWAVMHSLAEDDSVQFVHASYTGGVGMTPYFLALDHLEKKIVVTIRGTLSMKDLVTDLNADAEFIPVNPLQTNPPWLAHKGMISAAEYVKKRLIEEGKLAQMLDIAKARTGKHYDLMVVGHSLGAGAAAILAILLKPDFPTLKCICFSPPGGLLNLPVAEYTKTFITTCFLGKDVVTRLGLHQLEAMRADLLSVIQRSTTPKWRILLSSLFGCSPSEPSLQQFAEEQARSMSTSRRKPAVSPFMTTHPPMYLPGKIVQIVRSYPKQQKFGKTLSRVCCTKSQRTGHPAYQAIEVHRESFYEVCLSPSMLDDHMPGTMNSIHYT